MSIFVLGRSRTGKTPFASQIALALGFTHIMGSEWVRKRFPPVALADRQAFIDAITRFSLEELRRNPHACVEYIHDNYDLTQPCVFEGLRNPHDFVHLFDPRTDTVVLLEHLGNDLRRTGFESGLDIIGQYARYLVETELLPAERMIAYEFPEFHEPAGIVAPSESGAAGSVRRVSSLDAAILDFLTTFRPPQPSEGGVPPALKPHRVHADIPPIRTHIRGEYLFDMDLSHLGEHVPCTAFAVSSYAGSTPTFKVLLADGSVFSYVPPSALVDLDKATRSSEPPLELVDLVYHNCPGSDVCVHAFKELQGPVHVFIKRHTAWLEGEYLLTLDWYEGNDLLHLIALDNGQYAFVPHHKLKFKDGPRELPPYRKMHSEWKV